jgi:hypothetical protein
MDKELMDKEDRIRKRAYELWYGQGCPSGRDEEHWEQARREIEGAISAGPTPAEEAPAAVGVVAQEPMQHKR